MRQSPIYATASVTFFPNGNVGNAVAGCTKDSCFVAHDSQKSRLLGVEADIVNSIRRLPQHIGQPIIPRGPMRSPPRPFKIEFKNRSAKSAALGPPATEEFDKKISKPSFLDTSDFVAARSNRASGHDAVMEAANAVFARKVPASLPAETAPTPSISVGRVLPSLTDDSDALAIRLADADKKSRRKRGVEKAKEISAHRPTKTKAPPASAATHAPDEQATKEVMRETPNVAGRDRQRRSIHQRRLLDAELKAGEKWKRRLCKAAR